MAGIAKQASEKPAQKLNDESYAICKADMLIKGQDVANIIAGNTLSDDGHANRKFDYMLSNPPFGVEWKKVEKEIRKEHESQGFNGRFGPGLPRVSDGSLLFLMHLLSKMRPAQDEHHEFETGRTRSRRRRTSRNLAPAHRASCCGPRQARRRAGRRRRRGRCARRGQHRAQRTADRRDARSRRGHADVDDARTAPARAAPGGGDGSRERAPAGDRAAGGQSRRGRGDPQRQPAMRGKRFVRRRQFERQNRLQ